jgi:trk system potassium uptake protein
MKIVIAGAGEVGFHLAKLLSSQAQDIHIIDTSSDVLERAQSNLDVITVKGDSTSIKTLKAAGVRNADLLIAVTSAEQANIITAVIGKKLGAKITVARINNQEYLIESIAEDFRKIGIDFLFSPRYLASTEITRLVDEAALTALQDYEDGKLFLIGLTLNEDSPIVNKHLSETAHFNPDNQFKAIAICREHQTHIPRGDFQFRNGDQVFFITTQEGKDPILSLTGNKNRQIKKVMILGGSDLAVITAKKLERNYSVKLIEHNKDVCYELAEELNNTLVINGNGSNVELLVEEGLNDMDAFIALTDNSETNIISCLVAKNHKVQKTIALVENVDYIDISQDIGVDALINRKLIFANDIFRHIRKGSIKALSSIHGVGAEVIEYEVSRKSKITKEPIRHLHFPKKALIGGVIRGEESILPGGDFQIEVGDKVVVFALPEAIHQVEKYFK